MKNTTCEELIEILKTLDPKAVVCHMEFDGETAFYNSFEICRQVDNVTYLDDAGDDAVGNVIAFF